MISRKNLIENPTTNIVARGTKMNVQCNRIFFRPGYNSLPKNTFVKN